MCMTTEATRYKVVWACGGCDARSVASSVCNVTYMYVIYCRCIYAWCIGIMYAPVVLWVRFEQIKATARNQSVGQLTLWRHVCSWKDLQSDVITSLTVRWCDVMYCRTLDNQTSLPSPAAWRCDVTSYTTMSQSKPYPAKLYSFLCVCVCSNLFLLLGKQKSINNMWLLGECLSGRLKWILKCFTDILILHMYIVDLHWTNRLIKHVQPEHISFCRKYF